MEKRTILLWMMFFLFVCNSLVTLNLNVAIISMVRQVPNTPTDVSNGTNAVVCPNTTFFWSANSGDKSDVVNFNHEHTYNWSDYEKRMVLSAYHWLTFLSILPGGILAQRYGSKIVQGYSQCISAALSSIIPFAAERGARTVMYIRMVQGFLSFVAVPGAMMTIIGNWSSTSNRGRFISVALVGATLAYGFGSYLFGNIGQYAHWKYIFHLTSLCGIVWTVFWYFLVYDYPANHPTINVEEKSKILESMSHVVTDEKIPTPWKEILTNVPFLACTVFVGAISCIFFMLITFMPSYVNDMYGLSSNQTGIIISLPQFICGASAFIFGWLIDGLVKKQWLSITNTRKLFAIFGSVTASIPLIVLAYTKCNLNLMIVCYILSYSVRNLSLFGIEPTIIDLSPKFCGILQGIMGTLAELMTLAFATGLSHLTKLLSTEEFWKMVFLFAATIGIVASVVFFIWGSAETQSWNQGSERFRRRESHSRERKLHEPQI